MSIRQYIKIGAVALFGVILSSCNSNDDLGKVDIEIPGVTFDGDIDCCSAEEALQVYKFIQTVKIIPDLTTEIDGKYNVYTYTKTGSFHRGYNDIYFVVTKKKNGNYVKNFELTGITPHMLMVKMKMTHSTPASAGVESFNNNYAAVKRGWISFVMNTSDAGSWTLKYDYSILGSTGTTDAVGITVDALPAGQEWLKSFKVGDNTYYLSLVNPTEWATGKNTIKAYVSKKETPATTPYGLAQEQFSIEIDPRMPDMGNHTSPDNVGLTLKSDKSYEGTVNLTMTGKWRIHLTVKDSQGNVVAGGDDLSDGYSSLYWDVTI